jgi:hypothetical protein
VYWFLQSGWWLLHTSPQLHPDPWTWTSQGLPDCINPLGPEHCNQTLHCREGSAFPRTGQLHWSLQVPWWLYCPIPDIWFRSHQRWWQGEKLNCYRCWFNCTIVPPYTSLRPQPRELWCKDMSWLTGVDILFQAYFGCREVCI